MNRLMNGYTHKKYIKKKINEWISRVMNEQMDGWVGE